MASPRYQFDRFELDLKRYELRKDNHVLKLEKIPMELLILLVSRHGELVSREEIIEQIWGRDVFVETEHSINTAIRKIRQTLGDDSEHPRFVQTVVGKGYRFVERVGNGASSSTKSETQNGGMPESRWEGLESEGPPRALEARKVSPGPQAVVARSAAGRIRAWTIYGTAALVLLGAYVWQARRRTTRAPKLRMIQLQLTANPAGHGVTGAAISPDGRYLAYADDTGLHIKIVATGETRTLRASAETESVHSSWRPAAWFPDGVRFITNLEVPGKPPSVWILSIIGDAPRKFLDEGFAHAVSPDGQKIVVTRGHLGITERQLGHTFDFADQTLWLIPINGDKPVPLAEGDDATGFMHAVWSPDGNRIAYLRVHEGLNALECKFEYRDLRTAKTETVLTSDELLRFRPGSDPCRVPQTLWWGPNDRLIFSLTEPYPNEADFNLWEVELEPRNGKLEERLNKITKWVGFSFGPITANTNGSRIVFLNSSTQVNVYIADVTAGRIQINSLRRLTSEDRNHAPLDWSSDSRAVIVSSDRNGTNQVFRQQIDRQSAEIIATEGGWLPRTSPDGKSVLYCTYLPPSHGQPAMTRILQVMDDGKVETLMDLPRLGNLACARAPASLCFIEQATEDKKRIIISSLDPKRRVVRAVFATDAPAAGTLNWMPSADGSRLAFTHFDWREGRIGLVSLTRGSQQELVVKGWSGFNSVDWAADGKSLFVSSRSPNGVTLLQVDMTGIAKPLWNQRGGWRTLAIASPDGRHLALLGNSNDSNVWMIENPDY